jgi:hypothetical protein
MTGYTATFADGGTISIKNSRRDYEAAWHYLIRCPDGSITGNSGFARDSALADRAARAEAGFTLRHYKGAAELISVEIVGVARVES